MTDQVKIAVLSPRYQLPSPRSIRANNLVKQLVGKYQITVICFTNDVDDPTPSKFGEQVCRLKLSRRSKYITNKSFSGYRPKGVLRYLIGALNLILRKLFLYPDEWILEQQKVKKALNTTNPDIIIASMHPFSMGQMALDYKDESINKPKVILDIGDPFAFNAIGDKSSKQDVNFEKQILKRADHIIVTNESTKAHYVKTFDLPKENVSIITQGIDLETFQLKSVANKSDKYKLVYAGAFYPGLRDPRKFLKAMEAYSDKFDILIFGNHLPMFRESSSPSKFLGRVDQNELAIHYQDADALLFFDNKEGMQSSGKIYELLALKKPIIFIYDNEDSSTLQLCKEYKHLLYIRNKEDNIKEKINEIEAYIKSNLTYDYDVKQFSWEEKADQFDKILSTVNE